MRVVDAAVGLEFLGAVQRPGVLVLCSTVEQLTLKIVPRRADQETRPARPSDLFDSRTSANRRCDVVRLSNTGHLATAPTCCSGRSGPGPLSDARPTWLPRRPPAQRRPPVQRCEDADDAGAFRSRDDAPAAPGPSDRRRGLRSPRVGRDALREAVRPPTSPPDRSVESCRPLPCSVRRHFAATSRARPRRSASRG